MSNILPLVQKYRPKVLLDLYSQHTIIKIISKAIENNNIANVYLFTGSAGIGKTSTARIIAKIINCNNKVKKNDIIIACNNCKNCISKSHPDTIEIDAASHTTVDEMRNIIANTQYQSILGNHKIYIIDEAHMLSKSAFNAALKTFEEPNPNIVFILITTEPHRIPITIISRAQRLHFQSLTDEDTTALLTKICKEENIQYTTEALSLISQYSEGSARNAILLLEQANLLSHNEKLNEQLITNMLGIITIQNNIKFISHILTKNYSEIFLHIDNLRQNNTYMNLYIESFLKLINFIIKRSIYPTFKNNYYKSYTKEIDEFIQTTNTKQLKTIYVELLQAIKSMPNNIRNMYNFFDMIIVQVIINTENEAINSNPKQLNQQNSINQQNPQIYNQTQQNSINQQNPQIYNQTQQNSINQQNPQIYNHKTSINTSNDISSNDITPVTKPIISTTNNSTANLNNSNNTNSIPTYTNQTNSIPTNTNEINTNQTNTNEIKHIYINIILPLLKELYKQKNFGEYYDIFNHMEIQIITSSQTNNNINNSINNNINTNINNNGNISKEKQHVTIFHKMFSEKLIYTLQQKLSDYQITFTNTENIFQSIKQFIITQAKTSSKLYQKLASNNVSNTVQDLFFNTKC